MTSSTITRKSKSLRATTWKSRFPCRLAHTSATIDFCQCDVWFTGCLLCFLQHQEQVLTDTVDGREIYNTIRRKPKDAFYKNIVKKGYLLFNKGKWETCSAQFYDLSLLDVRLVSICNEFSTLHLFFSPSGKGKRWKNLYFILEGNDSQLIYFESEKRATKPKGLIDLSVCSVYGVHDSLFGRWAQNFFF